ncbi:MAG: dihydroneopterin aldolase [Fibromonadales bacterium]|nr:dihydroneopterin aldolase [Fibromonadales bacterium]
MVKAWISVNKILCETIIGIYPDELYTPQTVEFGFSFEYAATTDSIEDAVDYAVLTDELKAFAASCKFKLLETLTAEIAKKILAFSAKITRTKVYCIKLNELKPKAEIELHNS